MDAPLLIYKRFFGCLATLTSLMCHLHSLILQVQVFVSSHSIEILTSMQDTQAHISIRRASQSPSYHLLDKLTKALKEKMMNRLV